MAGMKVEGSSVEERVLEGLAVPLAQLVEDEHFACGCAAEAHVGVEHVDVPHEGRVDFSCINLLKVTNIDVEALDLTEDSALVEDDLLGVRKQLCVPAEESHSADFARHLYTHQEEGHGEEPRAA